MQVTCESKIYSDNIEKAKAKRKSAKELKKGVGSTRERAAEVTYLREYNLKSCCILPVKVALLKEYNWSIVVTSLKLVLRLHAKTSSPDVY